LPKFRHGKTGNKFLPGTLGMLRVGECQQQTQYTTPWANLATIDQLIENTQWMKQSRCSMRWGLPERIQ